MPSPRRRRLSCFATLSAAALVCYFFVVATHLSTWNIQNEDTLKEVPDGTIVAYSLLKSIELERREYHCGTLQRAPKSAQDAEEHKGWIKIDGSEVYVYSAHYDNRMDPYHYLRIIAMVKGELTYSLFCQIPTKEGYHITKAKATKIWSKTWNQNDNHTYYNPYLISCPLQDSVTNFTISRKPCELNSPIFYPPKETSPTRRDFTVCVKPLDFHEDISKQLLEWFLMNQILGADKFEVYISSLPPKSVSFLRKLSARVNISIHHYHRIQDESSESLWQKRRNELVAYNDCFYRNIHSSHYVIPVDIDEIIVPRQRRTWAELLHTCAETNVASYTVTNAYYLNPAKNHHQEAFFFRDIIRTQYSEMGESGKSFIGTNNTLTVFNHYALHVLKPGIKRNKFLKTTIVQMNHYKKECSVRILPECVKYLSSKVRVVDSLLWKFREKFLEKYNSVKTMLPT